MSPSDEHARPLGAHLENVAGNLQLVADLGYGDVALAAREPDGALRVVADARPMTAIAAIAHSRVGRVLSDDETEAYAALRTGGVVTGERRRTTRGLSYVTNAYPIGGEREPVGVLLRDLTQQVAEAPGKMEIAFMGIADDLISVLRTGPILTVEDGTPFVTTRVAGDGVMRLDEHGAVVYCSPNAVNIMKTAGLEGGLLGTPGTALPGGAVAIGPVLGSRGAHEAEVEAVGGHVLLYRSIALGSGTAVLVEDVTDARRREQELKVQAATIREVHHRVKNNLQTIASLLRIQARRSGSDEAARALSEAVERVSSMAVVHEMLSGSTDEQVDFGEAARTVVDMVRQGIAGQTGQIAVEVEGTTGDVPASTATSLALVTAELVHNAIEHGIGLAGTGTVHVAMRRLPGEIHLVVRDDGAGLPEGFDPDTDANLGLTIVRTIVADDLRGTLTFGGGRGTTVTIRAPVEGE